jgi:hypothetical protein
LARDFAAALPTPLPVATSDRRVESFRIAFSWVPLVFDFAFAGIHNSSKLTGQSDGANGQGVLFVMFVPGFRLRLDEEVPSGIEYVSAMNMA